MKRLGGVLLLTAVALTGCSAFDTAPSPTTTYTGAQGESITVDWADYPARAGLNGAMLLGRADQSEFEIELEARALLRELKAAVAEASGLEVTSSQPEREWFSDEDWYTVDGNGYGGESLLVGVLCCELATNTVPTLEKWQAVLDAVSEVTIAAGLGPIVRKQNTPEMQADPAWRKDYLDTYCNLDGGECWLWNGSADDGVQRVDFDIQDASLDPTRAEPKRAANADNRVDIIHISYAATAVRSGKSAEYARAIQPFLGLQLPPSTTYDE